VPQKKQSLINASVSADERRLLSNCFGYYAVVFFAVLFFFPLCVFAVDFVVSLSAAKATAPVSNDRPNIAVMIFFILEILLGDDIYEFLQPTI
jgi:hypothetical protein